MKAVKDNKEYDITENQKAEYLAQGYDIVQDGKVIEYSPKKTISYSEYQKVKKELEEAKENNTNVELTKTNADLTKQVEKLTKQLEKAN